MRRLIVAAALAVALILPTAASAIDPSLDAGQQAALAAPDAVYAPAVIRDSTGTITGANACGIEWTPNLARRWWARWFAQPLDLAGVRPGLMPGSLVLTSAEYTSAVALNARGNTLADAPRDFNPLGLPVTPGLVGADGVTFCPTDSAAPPVPLGASVAPSAITRLRGYIANLTRTGRDPAKLALYQARLVDYLGRP
jgi:hypothetical protein